MISNKVKELLFLPEYYMDEYNATPMKNYWPFLEKLIGIAEPDSVCEIGSERGLTSQMIGEHFKNTKEIHIVDPFISETLKNNTPENMILHEETSLDFFAKKIEVDLYFVDGDHNYYTVMKELNAIEKNRQNKQKTFVLLHDVSWFCGRRDQYYNEKSIPKRNNSYDSGAICLESDKNTQYGFRLDKSFTVSKKSGGPENGVLTAIEDFMANSALPWKFSYIPSLWGIGFLWLEDGFAKDEIDEITQILDKLDFLKEFFGILEANRLRLLQGLDEWRGTAEERLKELERVGKERQELYDVAEERLKELERVGKERQELYDVAEERLKELNTIKDNRYIKLLIKLGLV